MLYAFTLDKTAYLKRRTDTCLFDALLMKHLDKQGTTILWNSSNQRDSSANSHNFVLTTELPLYASSACSMEKKYSIS
jgi:hypothetical protein